MNPPGGMFTYVCGLVMHKNAKSVDKALALIDSSLSDGAAHYTLAEIGDGPANTAGLKKETEATFARLGIPRDVDSFVKSGIFQKPLKNKGAIVNAWTEIRAGL
jgi:spermidine/putrescine transport system substrate-binding protein